jgi:hypothetical protein
VVAHEYTHAVAESLWGGLGGNGEADAISEGVADVFGAIVEHASSAGPHNFVIGEGVVAGGIRSLATPALKTGIDHLSKLLPTPPGGWRPCVATEDVSHRNAGIVGHAFYLMTAGGTNPTSKIAIAKGIGWDAAQRVWWTAIQRMTEGAKLATLAGQTIAAAAALRVDTTPVACAWVATGVLPRERVKTSLGIDCAPGEVDQDIFGHWNWAGWGEWGTMSISRVGTQIRGVYTFRTGTVVLGERGADGWYRGCWSEATRERTTNGEFGPGWFRVRPDGSLDGRWHHLEASEWREDWDLSRTEVKAIPDADKARLADDTQFVPCN